MPYIFNTDYSEFGSKLTPMQTKLLNISNPQRTQEEDWSKNTSRPLQFLSHSTGTQKQIKRLTLQMLLHSLMIL